MEATSSKCGWGRRQLPFGRREKGEDKPANDDAVKRSISDWKFILALVDDHPPAHEHLPS